MQVFFLFFLFFYFIFYSVPAGVHLLLVVRLPLTAIRLKKLIQKSALPFEVIGEAHNGVTTLEDIKTLKPDVLFTDIQIPEVSLNFSC